MIPMQILSMWQPWAQFVVLGEKGNETRGFMPTLKGPFEIAIQATLKMPEEALKMCEVYQALLTWYGFTDPSQLPIGAIIGVATFECAINTEDYAYWHAALPLTDPRLPAVNELRFGNYGPKRKFWVFGDVYRLVNPIQCRGVQGMRALSPVMAERVRLASKVLVPRNRNRSPLHEPFYKQEQP